MTKQGYSIPQLAKESTVSRATISNILNQNADPSLSILEKLCKPLNIATKDLFAEKPVLKSLRFRTNKNMSAREKAAKETLLYTVTDKLEIYNQLKKYSTLNQNFSYKLLSKNPITAAAELRENLSLSTKGISNPCEIITRLNIKQFYFNFGLSKTFGLSVNKEDGGPAIFVNTGTANPERWIFTIFHELGHLILHPESYDGIIKDEEKNSIEETAANDFAAEFLLPQKVLREKVIGTREFSFIEKLIEIKMEYCVSYKTALKQYCKAFNREYSSVLSKFQMIYKNWKNFDFSNNKEPQSLNENKFTFVDSNFLDCIYQALKANDMEFSTAAMLLNKTENELKQEITQTDWTEKDDFPF